MSVDFRISLALITALTLVACGDGDPTGLDLPDLVEFRGTYTDASTCVQPEGGSWPITIWLYDYDAQTQAVRVAVRYRRSGGSHTDGEQFKGTLTRDGALQAFGYWSDTIHEGYEVQATVTSSGIHGNVYEHCDDGTADIWSFTAARHE